MLEVDSHTRTCALLPFPPSGVETAPPPSTALGVEVQQGAAGETDGKLRGGEGGRGRKEWEGEIR